MPLTVRLLTRIQTVESISLPSRFNVYFAVLIVSSFSATWLRSALLCATQQGAPCFWWTSLAREPRRGWRGAVGCCTISLPGRKVWDHEYWFKTAAI